MFHQICLCHIMHIRCWQKITNVEVLAHANITTISRMVRTSRLRWLGHVCRMPVHRLPKRVLFCELATGTRPRCRPCKRLKDVIKADLKIFNIEGNWQDLTQIKQSWRAAIRKGELTAEAAVAAKAAQQQERQHRWLKERLSTCEYESSKQTEFDGFTLLCLLVGIRITS